MVTKQKRFDVLVSALYQDLYRYACWLTGSSSVAEDLVQETYLRAWRAFEDLRDGQAAKAWLITILRRENARRFERVRPELVDVAETDVVDQAGGPDDVLDQRILRRAIQRLEVEFREPLILQLIGGFSVDEIAGILDMKKNTVLTRLYRARSKLREAVSETDMQRGSGRE